jgi:hypothetical protein
MGYSDHWPIGIDVEVIKVYFMNSFKMDMLLSKVGSLERQ